MSASLGFYHSPPLLLQALSRYRDIDLLKEIFLKSFMLCENVFFFFFHKFLIAFEVIKILSD